MPNAGKETAQNLAPRGFRFTATKDERVRVSIYSLLANSDYRFRTL